MHSITKTRPIASSALHAELLGHVMLVSPKTFIHSILFYFAEKHPFICLRFLFSWTNIHLLTVGEMV
jgi:hypothetical protein